MVVFDVCGGGEPGGDVGGDALEAPAVEVVEGELVAGVGALAAHDHAHGDDAPATAEGGDGVGDLVVVVDRRVPHGGGVRGEGFDAGPHRWELAGGHREQSVGAVGGGDELEVEARRVRPEPQLGPFP